MEFRLVFLIFVLTSKTTFGFFPFSFSSTAEIIGYEEIAVPEHSVEETFQNTTGVNQIPTPKEARTVTATGHTSLPITQPITAETTPAPTATTTSLPTQPPPTTVVEALAEQTKTEAKAKETIAKQEINTTKWIPQTETVAKTNFFSSWDFGVSKKVEVLSELINYWLQEAETAENLISVIHQYKVT
jgi:hypothetical protein